MTKDSAEEKMVQIGRKKMALDQALIESIDSKDDIPDDLESVLKHGAAALFSNDDQNDIHYNSISVDQLLDRTQVENTETGKDKTAESQFSFARVWANDKGTLTEGVGDPDAEAPGLDQKFWENILEQRNADAAAEKAKNVEALGRGKRAKVHMNYGADDNGGDEAIPQKPGRKRRGRSNSASDVDFVSAGDSDGDDDLEGIDAQVDAQELGMQSQRAHSRSKFIAPSEGTNGKISINTLSTPPKQAPSGQRSRGSVNKGSLTINLNFSAKSVKAQKGGRKQKEIAKKSIDKIKARLNIGSVAKQPISKNSTSSGKLQAAQLSGRPATPNSLDTKPVLVANTASEVKACCSRPAIDDTVSQNIPSKTPLESSDRRSQISSRNGSNDHQCSEQRIRQPANTTFPQIMPTPSNAHQKLARPALASPAHLEVRLPPVATAADVPSTPPDMFPSLTLSTRTTPASTVPTFPHLRQGVFSMQIDMEKMKEDQERNWLKEKAFLDILPNYLPDKLLESTLQVQPFSVQPEIDRIQAANPRTQGRSEED